MMDEYLTEALEGLMNVSMSHGDKIHMSNPLLNPFSGIPSDHKSITTEKLLLKTETSTGRAWKECL
jgi:hypothetical protein